MPNKVYDSAVIRLVNGTEIFMTPLKIKYLREFMESFERMHPENTEDETLGILLDCTRISMKQYYPLIKSIEDVEDNIDIKTMYKILEIAAGIKINGDDVEEKTVTQQANESSPKWSEMDLAGLESELFLLGIWKDYDELESSLSMPELTTTLNAKRESDYREKKFYAAMQGIDLDKESGKKNEWEEMKARVFSGGAAANSDDILAYQGVNAQKAGFGIGMGLTYERID